MIMSATNFKTVNQTYRQLISNGTYSIPRFQRDYSWTDEEWDDLWEDILNVIRDDEDQVNDDARFNCTITEMIYVYEEIQDGSYLLNLQFASFENDASPSKPVLYSLE